LQWTGAVRVWILTADALPLVTSTGRTLAAVFPAVNVSGHMPIEKWSDRIVIVHLSADPHLGEDLQSAFDLVEQKPVDVVVDFGGVRYLNSSHLARLLKLRKAMVTAEKRLVLSAVDTQVWGAFLVTGLDKVFEFADAVPTALAAVQIGNPG
jgi:anti-anti-sigma factor